MRRDDQHPSVEAITPFKPGHLLAPFGWASDALATIVKAEPKLLIHLFELDRARLHLIALAFAHLNDAPPDICASIVSGSTRAITQQILGYYPSGIKRALDHLPSEVLAPENYRKLVELLADQETAKLLHHAQFIDDRTIKTLHGLPPPLRNPCILRALDHRDREYGFSDGLRLLVARGAASSFDALVSELASASHPGQIFAKIRNLVEALPLPDALPPPQVSTARRLDQTVAIRSLAESWRNCLARFLDDLNAGTCAVYFWDDPNLQAACLVRRYGRLGWFVEDAKGPRNVDVEPGQLAKISAAFSDAGISQCETIAAILCMIREAETEERHGRRILMPLADQ
jgi:hypothetical protein